MRIKVLVSALALLVAACAVPAESGEEATTAPAPDTTTPTTVALEEPVSSTPSVDQLIPVAVAARVDLASRLDVSENDIQITSLAAGTWRDGSLGCPEEGMSYTQALVNGTRVTLVYDGTEYSYHLGGDGDIFLCEEPAEDSFTVSKSGDEALQMIPPPGFDE